MWIIDRVVFKPGEQSPQCAVHRRDMTSLTTASDTAVPHVAPPKLLTGRADSCPERVPIAS